MTTNKMAVICCTYRNPEKPSLARLYGIMSLIDQIQNQSFKGDVKIVIVDDSPEPHPFIQGLANAMDDRLLYFHVPERNNLPLSVQQNFAKAAGFFPKDEDFKANPYWKNKIEEAQAWHDFLPFDDEFAKTFRIDLPGQMLSPRPTLGMKRNFGCSAYVEATGSLPDVFVHVDDDDHRSPDYLQIVWDGIQGYNFARVAKTFCHNVSPDPMHRVWGEIDFDPQIDINNNWIIPADIRQGKAYKYHEGRFIERPVTDLYPRNLLLSWPLISHDGCLHNYSGETWKKAVQEFGGIYPSTFSDDILTYRNISRLKGFKAAKIAVAEAPFIRCSDGRNASDFYATKIMDGKDVPSWCNDALAPLYRATDLSVPYATHNKILHDLGRTYARTGKIDLSAIQRPAPLTPSHEATPV